MFRFPRSTGEIRAAVGTPEFRSTTAEIGDSRLR
jgi:hypothetical protein